MPQENILPPTTKSPPIPTPPHTCSAPESVDVADVMFLITNVLVVPVEVKPPTPRLTVTIVPELVTTRPSPTKSKRVTVFVSVLPWSATARLAIDLPPGVLPSERRSSPVTGS